MPKLAQAPHGVNASEEFGVLLAITSGELMLASLENPKACQEL